MDETTKKILEIVTETQEHLLSFSGRTEENFREVRSEISNVRHDLEDLQNRVGDMGGYAKEIDLLLSRVSAVEKHVGISK
jgi:hypothetical protein